MPKNSQHYRAALHRLRAHPSKDDLKPRPQDQTTESLTPLYLSAIAALVLEYVAERSIHALPTGFVFPATYLLFWAFYYTYVRPGFLEKNLAGENKWDQLGIFGVLLGGLIWTVKVFLLEFVEQLLSRWLFTSQKTRPLRERPIITNAQKPIHQPPPAYSSPPLPPDVQSALGILGLRGCRDFNVIQKRYRELAKKYHPDLNPDITTGGRRFMLYDAAYRKLTIVKEQYFSRR